MRPLHRLTAALAIGLVTSLLPVHAAHAAPFRVTLKVSQSEVTSGETVRLTGKVTPAAKGARVTIQRSIDNGAWKRLATVRLSKKSTFRHTDRPTVGGTLRYRVVKPKAQGRTRGISPARAVTAFRWIHLTRLPASRRDLRFGASQAATQVINGWSYPEVILLPKGSRAHFRLDRQCTTIRAVVGMPAGDSADAVVFFDDEDNNPLGLGVPVSRPYYAREFVRSIGSVEELRIVIGTTAGAPDTLTAAVGDARVRCRF